MGNRVNWIYRGIINLARNKIKYSILFLLIFIVGTVISGSIIIYRASTNTIDNLKRNMITIITLDHYYNVDLTSNNHQYSSQNMLNEIASHPAVEMFDYFNSIHGLVFSNYLREINCDATNQKWMGLLGFIPDTPSPGEGYTSHTLVGFSKPDIIYIERGYLLLVDGRSFNEQDMIFTSDQPSPAIISRKFAYHNNLWIGDIFTLSVHEDTFSGFPVTSLDDASIFYFEIIGIRDFEERTTLNVGDYRTIRNYAIRQTNFENEIFIPYRVVSEIQREILYKEPNLIYTGSISIGRIFAHFSLTNPIYLTDFMNHILNTLPDDIDLNQTMLSDHSERFSSVAHATSVLKEITRNLMIFTLISGIFIITFVLMIFIHEKKFEFGIYLSLGEQKKNIFKQIMFEVIIISMMAVLSSLLLSNILSNEISRNILMNEIISFEEVNNDAIVSRTLEISFGQQPLTIDEMVDAFDVNLSISDVINFTVVSLFTISLSLLISIKVILRIKPIKLLR